MSRTATLPFLGSRTYFHGTTLFELLEPEISGGRDILFQVSRPIMSDRVAISAIDPAAEDRKKYNAFAIWTHGGNQIGRGILALPPSEFPQRMPYDEDAIQQCATFTKNSVTLQKLLGVGLLKAAIALNKSLLFHVVEPPNDGRQWLFTRLELDALPPADALFELVYRSRYSFSAVKTDIKFMTGETGVIYFSWQTLPK